jgi:hypothetical protein
MTATKKTLENRRMARFYRPMMLMHSGWSYADALMENIPFMCEGAEGSISAR